MFLLALVRARATSISLRVRHRHLLCHRHAREAREWVEVEDKAHRLELQGPKGVSTQLYHRLNQRIIQLYRVCFYYRLWARILFDSGASKDQNIGKHGYIGNWILRKYRKYRKISVDILTKISVMEKLTKIL